RANQRRPGALGTLARSAALPGSVAAVGTVAAVAAVAAMRAVATMRAVAAVAAVATMRAVAAVAAVAAMLGGNHTAQVIAQDGVVTLGARPLDHGIFRFTKHATRT